MKVINLGGQTSNFPPVGYIVPLDDIRPRSAGHLKCRQLLRNMFPTLTIQEEVPINIRQGLTLYLDFYIPQKHLAIEVNGGQHDEYTPFFHKSKADFTKSRGNDRLKAEWCQLNNISLVVLSDGDDWNERIANGN
jgi:hypothetical protein